MNNLTIRKAELSDAKQIMEIYSYYVAQTAISFDYEMPDETAFKKKMTDIMQKYPYILASCGDEIIGFAYASDFISRKAYERCAELTVYLRNGYQGKGIGKKLFSELERILGEMGFTNLYACIAVPVDEPDSRVTSNSIDFHEHMGFRTVGTFYKCGYKFGNWYNMVWAEKIIASHSANPEKLKEICNVRY